MKNNQGIQLSILMVLCIGFQKLIAQPQFIIQDKVVFVTSNNIIQDKVVFANPPNQAKTTASASIIQDTIVFVESQSSSSSNSTSSIIKFDSIHKRLVALKKGSYEKATNFNWYKAHPTNSLNIEGYNIVIVPTQTAAKPIAEFRFIRQQTKVWVDEKFKNPANAADIKTVVYSEQNRKAAVETFGGYKFSLSIDAKTGKIDITKGLALDRLQLSNYEVRIYKTPKLF